MPSLTLSLLRRTLAAVCAAAFPLTPARALDAVPAVPVVAAVEAAPALAAAAAPPQERRRRRSGAAARRSSARPSARSSARSGGRAAARAGTRRRGTARGSRAGARAGARNRAAPRPVAVVRPTYVATRGAAALGGALGNLLSRREDGRWGVMVVSLTRGDTLFAREPDVPVLPASTLKMYTSVLAFDRLGPDWRFRTEVLRGGAVGADGTLAGDLVLRGDGDPSLSRRFWAGPEFGHEYDAPVRALARRVAEAGVKRVTGGVVADASAFEARAIPEGWLSRYAGSAYAAPFGALTLNENIVVVAVHPDGRVLVEPPTAGIRVENGVRVVGGNGTSVRVFRAPDGHVVARGTVGRRAPVRRLQLTVGDPTLFTAGAFAAALRAEGVRVDGDVRVGRAPAGAEPVAAVESPPLSTLVAVMNRESINVFAENIFRRATAGLARDAEGSAAAGNAALQRLLAERAAVPAGAVQVSDGSGLSVLDRVTARSMVHLLGYAHRAPWGPAFHASLPVAGESELMRHRMAGTPAAGNVHAKTGTTNDVIALGGYATAENGELLAFAFVFNGRDRWNARATIDAMGATLASFAR